MNVETGLCIFPADISRIHIEQAEKPAERHDDSTWRE